MAKYKSNFYGLTPAQVELIGKIMAMSKRAGRERFFWDLQCRSMFFGDYPGKSELLKIEPAEVASLVEKGMLTGHADPSLDGCITAGTVTDVAYSAVQTKFKGPGNHPFSRVVRSLFTGTTKLTTVLIAKVVSTIVSAIVGPLAAQWHFDRLVAPHPAQPITPATMPLTAASASSTTH